VAVGHAKLMVRPKRYHKNAGGWVRTDQDDQSELTPLSNPEVQLTSQDGKVLLSEMQIQVCYAALTNFAGAS